MNQKLDKYVKTDKQQDIGPGSEIIETPKEGLAVQPDIIALALDKDLDLDRMKLLIEMKGREDEKKAKMAYAEAMAQFKLEPLVILKDMKNSQYHDSPYASKGHLVNTVIPVFAKYGFAHKWEMKQENGLVKITCVITHKLGHSESSSFEAPPDKSGSKNPIQEIKSTRTYGEVITFEDAVGISACDTDVDDDGNLAGGNFLTEERRDKIDGYIKQLGDLFDEAKFLKVMKANSLDTILDKDIGKAINNLNKMLGINS